MNTYAPLAGVLGRIADTTGALRVRTVEATQAEHNGGSIAELRARVEAVIAQLEKAAAELEQKLA